MYVQTRPLLWSSLSRKLPLWLSCFHTLRLYYLRTFLGKLICGLCALCGVFILTLPIPIVVSSFAQCYKRKLWRNEIATRRRMAHKYPLLLCCYADHTDGAKCQAGQESEV